MHRRVRNLPRHGGFGEFEPHCIDGAGSRSTREGKKDLEAKLTRSEESGEKILVLAQGVSSALWSSLWEDSRFTPWLGGFDPHLDYTRWCGFDSRPVHSWAGGLTR